MFERYSEEARRAIFFARYECSQYGSPTIESEHLLLGLLRETTLLKRLLGKDQEPKILRAEVEKQITRRPHIPPSTEMPFSTECTRILRLAVEESERLGHGYVEPEHLLLGLLREEQCLGARILQVHEVTLLRTREEVTRQGQGSKPNFSRVARSPRIRVDPAVWKFGSYLAAIRLVALLSIVIAFRYGEWRQVPGHIA
jgi:ATP-dependent Clp protease ATP-binding subunit ClpC